MLQFINERLPILKGRKNLSNFMHSERIRLVLMFERSFSDYRADMAYSFHLGKIRKSDFKLHLKASEQLRDGFYQTLLGITTADDFYDSHMRRKELSKCADGFHFGFDCRAMYFKPERRKRAK